MPAGCALCYPWPSRAIPRDAPRCRQLCKTLILQHTSPLVVVRRDEHQQPPPLSRASRSLARTHADLEQTSASAAARRREMGGLGTTAVEETWAQTVVCSPLGVAMHSFVFLPVRTLSREPSERAQPAATPVPRRESSSSSRNTNAAAKVNRKVNQSQATARPARRRGFRRQLYLARSLCVQWTLADSVPRCSRRRTSSRSPELSSRRRSRSGDRCSRFRSSRSASSSFYQPRRIGKPRTRPRITLDPAVHHPPRPPRAASPHTRSLVHLSPWRPSARLCAPPTQPTSPSRTARAATRPSAASSASARSSSSLPHLVPAIRLTRAQPLLPRRALERHLRESLRSVRAGPVEAGELTHTPAPPSPPRLAAPPSCASPFPSHAQPAARTRADPPSRRPTARRHDHLARRLHARAPRRRPAPRDDQGPPARRPALRRRRVQVDRQAPPRRVLAGLRLGVVRRSPLSPLLALLSRELTLLSHPLARRIGHFFFEKNRPATFKHPFYSFLGDLTLWKEVMTFQRRP